jgi:hypothetical protein
MSSAHFLANRLFSVKGLVGAHPDLLSSSLDVDSRTDSLARDD